MQYRFAEAMCEEVAGWVLVFARRYSEAIGPLTRGLELARDVARRFETILLVGLAHVAWDALRHDEAREHLRKAWAISEEVGSRFAGPLVQGALAKCAATPVEQRQALADGERLLQQECVSHCYFGFYQTAIDVALDRCEWSEAERYAGLLDDYARAEPLPIMDLLVARGRALAAAGRGQGDRDALAACRERALAFDLVGFVPALDAALARAA
jgi:hypothetical protein